MAPPRFRMVPAVHPHWKGNLRLSLEDDRMEHEEQGTQGSYKLEPPVLTVNWADFGEERFIEIEGMFINETLVRQGYRRINGDYDIPSTIFQTWKSKVSLPANFAEWRNTFSEHNPSYEMLLWDDADNRQFVRSYFPWFYRRFMAYPLEIHRADLIRYLYLYKHGGIYVDLDVECLRPLDGLLGRGDVVLGQMGNGGDHSIPNAIMLSKPKEEFWLFVVWLSMQVVNLHEIPELVTGPVLLKAAVDLYNARDPILVKIAVSTLSQKLPGHSKPTPRRSNLSILPPLALYPLDWVDPAHQLIRKRVLAGEHLSSAEKNELFPHSWTTTYWSHSW